MNQKWPTRPGIWLTAMHKEQGQQKGPPDRNFKRMEQRPPNSPNNAFPAYEWRNKAGRGEGRPNSKPSGMNDPYGIENQVIPVGVHNLSKSFRPNMATIRVLSLGTKFIPK